MSVPAAPQSRNAPCPCGSARRYKDCHGAPAASIDAQTLDALMPAALAAHQAGRIDEAARLYERALTISGDQFDALHMLGVVHFQRQAFGRARELIARAVALRPDVAQARRNLRLVDNAMKRARAQADYLHWVATVERRDSLERAPSRERLAADVRAPLLSIVMPTFNSPESSLRDCLDGVIAQSYPGWELCIADDASTVPHVRRILDDYVAREPRMRVSYREVNGHISAASNTALGMARGEFVVLLDHDDALAPHALAEVALEILANPDANIVYSDEDKIDATGQRFEPYFKPDWNPALLTAQNYVSHLGVYRIALVREAGGFREGVEGAQDWDLLLRCAERIPATTIRHIPRVLYHWRAVAGSTAQSMDNKRYAAAAQERVVREAFERRGVAVSIRRVQADAFLECVPVAQPPPRATFIVLREPGADLARWHEAAAANHDELLDVEVPACRIDGAARTLDRSSVASIQAAAGHARGEILVIVDACCEPPQADRLAEWMAMANQPSQGPVGALVLDARRDVVGGAFILDRDGIAAPPWLGEAEGFWGMAGRNGLIQHVSAVRLDAMAIRRTLWMALGGLDTARLAARYLDVDLCLRCSDAGCRPLWFPGVVLVHERVLEEPEAAPIRAEDADAQRMRARWLDALDRDPAYHPSLARAPHLFDLELDPDARSR